MGRLFAGWREELATCRKFAPAARSYTACRLLSEVGLRVNEACKLDLPDIKTLRSALAKAAGTHLPDWPDVVTPHVLRHFCASQLYLGGMDLIAIQATLGHYVGDLCQVDHVVVRYRRDAAAGERLSSWPISAQVWPWSRAA